MNKLLLLTMLILCMPVSGQLNQPPFVNKNYKDYTSYSELTDFINGLGHSSSLIKTEVIGKSVQGRNIYAIKFSLGKFGSDKEKIKILIFAQQHGNEQSGKEGALLLAAELIKPENHYLFDNIDLAIIPQMNPDGSEARKRLNGHDQDLNRNHLVMTEPEVIALHDFFDRYLFEVTMDVHEYYPYGDSWKKEGYRLNTDEFIGPVNNPATDASLRDLSNDYFLPYMKQYLAERSFTNFIYSPGGPPGKGYIRHSTFDINDGRQSFGIQNSFSFIQEGINGIDYSSANLRHRAEGQETGMMSLLLFTFKNKDEIKKSVEQARISLTDPKPGSQVPIQYEHTGNGHTLELPVFSYSTKKDSVITVTDYRPVVKTLHEVIKPDAYLVPSDNRDLADWIKRQALIHSVYKPRQGDAIEQYQVVTIDSTDFEGDRVVDPNVVTLKNIKVAANYIYIPVNQLKGNMIVIGLEPKSMLGLVTYKQFAYLLRKGEKYPVLRVFRAR